MKSIKFYAGRYGRAALCDLCVFKLCYTLRGRGSKIPALPRREGTMVGVNEINSTWPLAPSSRGLRMTLICL